MSNTDLLTKCLDDNVTKLAEKFKECPDIIIKNILLKDHHKGCFIYINGLVDIDLLQKNFVNPVLNIDYTDLINENIIHQFSICNLSLCYDFESLLYRLLSGETILLIDGMNFTITCNLLKFEKRAIHEPPTEKNVRGPHDGFIEILDINISILRRILKNTNLKFKTCILGDSSKQTVAIAYIEGIANPELLDTLFNKINTIQIDVLPSIGHIEQLITDSKHAIFPQYMAIESPQRAVAALMEGRLVIMLDGTPVTLIAPVTFFTFLKAPDDYSSSWMYGSFMGLMRFIAIIVAVLLPSLYISLASFNYNLVPYNLLVPLAQSRANVPFPPIVEALIMEFAIELIRESSIRLPTYIGATSGVVGGIVMGEVAVNAGLVSSLLIIIVAVTSITSFVTPTFDFGIAIRLLRFGFLILTALFGIIGLNVALILTFAHLISLESLGQPFFQPIFPFKAKDLKDTIVRLPIKQWQTRPDIAKPIDKKRGKN